MTIPFDAKVTVPEDVMVSQFDREVVLLNLGSESYFGLKEVGARGWELLTSCDSIQKAYEVLLGEYDVDRETLHQDLAELIDVLVERGLVTVDNV